MKKIVAVLGAVALIALLVSQAGAATLIGQWTFDGKGGTDKLENKAAGTSWATMNLVGAGASVVNGELVLARYQDTMWKQSSATTLLRTDFGPAGYFKEMTQVAWIKWGGFDTSTTGTWSRVTNMIKLNSDSYDPANLTNTRAAQSIMMKATDNYNWGSNHSGETGTTPFTQSQFFKNGGSDPPTNSYIKIAQVFLYFDNLGAGGTARYQQKLYWDIGAGLVQVGVTVAVLEANTVIDKFGQYGTASLNYPANGLRYDGFGLMDYSWSTPQSAGDIRFDEARIYSGVLSVAEMGALTAEPFVPEPSSLLALACGGIGLVGFAIRRRR